MWEYNYTPDPNELYHYGILGMKWGVRRYQNKDGSLTNAGRRHYYGDASVARAHSKYQEAVDNRKKAQRNGKNIKPAKDNEYRSEFEYKTKREAARIRSKNIEFKKKSKYRQKLEAQYKKLGLSDEDAQAAANRKIRAEKILAASAALTVAACAAYLSRKAIRNKIDGVIKSGTTLQRIEMINTGGKLHDIAYVAKGQHDMNRYGGLLGAHRFRQTGHAYLMKLEAASDIKVASRDKAMKTFGNLLDNDAEFRSIIMKNMPGYNGETKLSGKKLKQLYENFNRGFVVFNRSDIAPNGIAPAKKFYDKLKAAGYGAIQDVNDMDYSGYRAKNPLIVFDKANENIMVKSMREMTLTEINRNLAREQVKMLQEVKIENLLDQGAQTGLGVSATIAGAAIGSRVSDPSKDKRLKKR